MTDEMITLSTTTVQLGQDQRGQYLRTTTVDALGHELSAHVTNLPAPHPTYEPMRIGFVSPPRATAENPYGWAAHFRALPPDRCQVIAAYNEPGTKVDEWAMLPPIPEDTDVHIRIKDPLADPWFTAWLKSTPATVRRLLVTHRHEYKGGTPGQSANVDESLAVWFEAWRFGRRAIDAAGMKGRALLTPYFMNAWVQDKGQLFENVWPTGPNGERICDKIAFSCYSNESLTGYRTPQDLFKIAIDWARRANVQLVIPEWGMQIDSGKPGQTDELRAGVIRETLPYLRSLKFPDGRPLVDNVTWWSSLSTNKSEAGIRNDFRLLLPGAKLSLAAYIEG